MSLSDSAEAQYASKTRICLLVAVSDTHATTCSDVEARELALVVDDGDEADIVGEDIDVVLGQAEI